MVFLDFQIPVLFTLDLDYVLSDKKKLNHIAKAIEKGPASLFNSSSEEDFIIRVISKDECWQK